MKTPIRPIASAPRARRPTAGRAAGLVALLLVAGAPAGLVADSARSHQAPSQPRVQPQAQPPSQPRVQPARTHQPAAPPVAQNPYAHMLPPYIPGSVSIPHRRETGARSPGYRVPHQPLPQVYPIYVPVEPRYEPRYEEPRYEPPAQPVVVVVEAPRPEPPAPPPPAPSPPPPPPRPRDTEPGEVWLDIAPRDARVLLDDRLLGAAGELSDPDDPLILAAGVYVLEVEHADHRRQRLMFAAGSRTPVLIEVDLAEEEPRRRARLTTPSDLPLARAGSSPP